MTGPGLVVRPLDESTWPAFAALVEANGGIFGGCWCMGMHPDGLDRQSANGNRERKLALVRDGSAHAALVFDGDDCVGWAKFGPPAELARIKNRAAAEKDRPLPTGGSAAATSARAIDARVSPTPRWRERWT